MEKASVSTIVRAVALAIGAVLFWAFGFYIGLIFGSAPVAFSWGVTGMTLFAVLNLISKFFQGRIKARPQKTTPEQKKWAEQRQQTSMAVGICYYASLIIEDDENVLLPLRNMAQAGDAEAATRLHAANATLGAMNAAVTAFNAYAVSADKTGVLAYAKPVAIGIDDWKAHRAFLVERGHPIGPGSSFWG